MCRLRLSVQNPQRYEDPSFKLPSKAQRRHDNNVNITAKDSQILMNFRRSLMVYRGMLPNQNASHTTSTISRVYLQIEYWGPDQANISCMQEVSGDLDISRDFRFPVAVWFVNDSIRLTGFYIILSPVQRIIRAVFVISHLHLRNKREYFNNFFITFPHFIATQNMQWFIKGCEVIFLGNIVLFHFATLYPKVLDPFL